MFRIELAKRNGERDEYTGIFVRTGVTLGHAKPKSTVLLVDIRDRTTGALMADHLWFKLTKGFQSLNLQANDIVSFRGRSQIYMAGYKGTRDDVEGNPIKLNFMLARPTKIQKIGRSDMIVAKKTYIDQSFLDELDTNIPSTVGYIYQKVGCSRDIVKLRLVELERIGKVKRVEIRGGSPAWLRSE